MAVVDFTDGCRVDMVVELRVEEFNFHADFELVGLDFCLILGIEQEMRKHAFCTCENKGTDQLSCNCAADHHLCFCYTDSTIPLLPKSTFQASSHLLCMYSPACVGPGRKLRRQVFS